MTTDDLPVSGAPAANGLRIQGIFCCLFATALCLGASPALAKTSATAGKDPVAVPAHIADDIIAVQPPDSLQSITGSTQASETDAATAAAPESPRKPNTRSRRQRTADVTVTTPEPSPVPQATASTSRNKADAAAAATLAALLPHMGSNNTIPLLDRSAMFAGDIGRMLANYDLSQGGISASSTQNGNENRIRRVLRGAMALMGTPYRWGGTSPDTGFDCSGLVSYVFQHALGIELPRISRDMAVTTEGDLIKDRSQLTPGDLVFFGRSGRINHVGIYVGEGRFLHAPSTGKDVRIDSMTSGYWSDRFLQARRLEI